MVTTRTVAYRLASTTAPPIKLKAETPKEYPFLEVSQKKISIPNPTEETVKGPIRLRLLRLSEPSVISRDKKDL